MLCVPYYLMITEEETGLKPKLENLYKLMPGNPKWMDGARSGAIIPLVLFRIANVDWVIPSDLNLINGVINDLK